LGKRACRCGSPARELEPATTHRLGVDRWGAGGKEPRSLGRKFSCGSLRDAIAGQLRKINCD
jgi:hypothetical protein